MKILAAMIVTGVAALTLTACGGGSKDAAAGGTPQPSAGGSAPTEPAAGSGTQPAQIPTGPGKPLPSITPAAVKGLAGTWNDTSKASKPDTFTFTAAGKGSWTMSGKILWTGSVIPQSKNVFRLSWEGKDPGVSNYWQVTLSANGKSLVFAGNGQTYKKG